LSQHTFHRVDNHRGAVERGGDDTDQRKIH
jgi:hypothetical protein